jgi:hypothetical protein
MERDVPAPPSPTEPPSSPSPPPRKSQGQSPEAPPVPNLNEGTAAPESTKETELAKVNGDKKELTERRRIKYQPGKMADLLRWKERFPNGIQPPEPPALSLPIKVTTDNPGETQVSPATTTGKSELNKKTTHAREEAPSPVKKQPILRYTNGGPHWTRRDPKPKAETRPSGPPRAQVGPSRENLQEFNISGTINAIESFARTLVTTSSMALRRQESAMSSRGRHTFRGGRKVQERRRKDQLETSGDGQHRRQSK